MYLDPRMPRLEDCVLRELIDRRASESPDQVVALFQDGTTLTNAELREEVLRCAAGLQRLGVSQGDSILSWLPNKPDSVVLMFAVAYLGAIFSPVNTAYRGALLEHVIRNSGAKLMVADGSYVDRLEGLDIGDLQSVVMCGNHGNPVANLRLTWLPESSLQGDPVDIKPLERPICPWDTFAVIYTSGTTGPSKGVLVSYLQVHQNYLSNGYWLPEDRALIALPMFHMAGAGLLASTLMRGGSFALVESFRTQDFWSHVKRFQATNTTLLGVMCAFLLKADPSPEDRNHTLRRAMCVPLSNQHQEFTRRFGTEIFTLWNMTETSTPLFCGPNPARLGTAGRPRKGVEVRIVDDNDCEVPVGQVGQLVVRTDMPFAMSHGYLNNPEATSAAWRNGWFHTGDAFRRDEQGYFYFVDRIKDAIRRRGENISSFEVEKEILAHPSIRDAAVVAVPSEFSEDEVMAVISVVPGKQIDFSELVRYLQPRLAKFMLPRYFRLMDDLPRTPTNKVEKHRLRMEGLTPDTWDRDQMEALTNG